MEGVIHGEVYTGMGKYEKVMLLNFSEARVDRGLWRKLVDESQWPNSDRRVAASASSHRLAQHLFLSHSSILDRNIVNRAVNCSVNSISDDSQEILRLCACVRTLACISDGCLRLFCVHVSVHE